MLPVSPIFDRSMQSHFLIFSNKGEPCIMIYLTDMRFQFYLDLTCCRLIKERNVVKLPKEENYSKRIQTKVQNL
jgi:hypothetical protein